MSGRIRSIKPEWLEDEKLAELSPHARVMSIALLLMADDYGNGRANLRMLAPRVFPFSSEPVVDGAEALLELVHADYVRLYEVDGQRYYNVRNWEKHQRVDKPGKPIAPEFPGTENANDVGFMREIRGILANIRGTLAPDRKGEEGKGREIPRTPREDLVASVGAGGPPPPPLG
jgi:hypothetical protein